jgi:methyl-accepting chemotaxis protein
MSRLKKKLLLYFLLISIVSLSVSAEVILELGSPAFRGNFKKTLHAELIKEFSEPQVNDFLNNRFDQEVFFDSISDLQIRFILLLLVIGFAIGGAFFLFAKDIVAPMEGMVIATKKIADGDLSASVPVKSQDEIGQIGKLINDMSVNLQEMIIQIRQEVIRLRHKINEANQKITRTFHGEDIQHAISSKKMKMADLKEVIKAGDDISTLLDDMVIELSSLQAFVNMYKVFQVTEDVQENKKAILALKNENIGDVNM